MSADAHAVVEGMREHPANATIQRKACARLLDLTPSVESAEFQRIQRENGEAWKEMDRKYRELASAGVIDVVCQAISTQPAEVAATGCRILRFLARIDANMVQIAALGGIETLLKAMEEHPAHSVVQEEACAALLNLGTSNRDMQQRIKRAGAAEQVGRAMAASNATDDTKKWGQILLDRLANT